MTADNREDFYIENFRILAARLRFLPTGPITLSC